MTAADIDTIEARWHRLGVLMRMPVPDAGEVERQYEACLLTVPQLIAEVRRLREHACFTLDTADHVEESES